MRKGNIDECGEAFLYNKYKGYIRCEDLRKFPGRGYIGVRRQVGGAREKIICRVQHQVNK